MKPPSARHALMFLLLAGLALSASADARGRHAKHAPRAPQAPPLTLSPGGCRFQPPVEAIFQRLTRQFAGQPPGKVWVRSSYAFGPLHGIGVAMESHAGFSGHELYFREDQAALQRALTAAGLHVDRRGDLVEAARFVDKKGRPLLGVSIHGIGRRKAHPHFPAARSWIGCGAL